MRPVKSSLATQVWGERVEERKEMVKRGISRKNGKEKTGKGCIEGEREKEKETGREKRVRKVAYKERRGRQCGI